MADEHDNKQNELPKSQQELFRSMMVKEMLHKIQKKLVEGDNESALKTIKNYAEESQFIKALKMMKDKNK